MEGSFQPSISPDHSPTPPRHRAGSTQLSLRRSLPPLGRCAKMGGDGSTRPPYKDGPAERQEQVAYDCHDRRPPPPASVPGNSGSDPHNSGNPNRHKEPDGHKLGVERNDPLPRIIANCKGSKDEQNARGNDPPPKTRNTCPAFKVFGGRFAYVHFESFAQRKALPTPP